MTSALRSGVIDIGSPICQRESPNGGRAGMSSSAVATSSSRRQEPARLRRNIVKNSPDASGIYAPRQVRRGAPGAPLVGARGRAKRAATTRAFTPVFDGLSAAPTVARSYRLAPQVEDAA